MRATAIETAGDLTPTDRVFVIADPLDFRRRTSPFKLRFQPGIDDGFRQFGADDPRAQRDDLRIIAFARPLGGVGIVPVPHSRIPRRCFSSRIACATR